MKRNRHIGFERCNGFDVGLDPRAMSTDALEHLGHVRVSPLRALRLKCLDVATTLRKRCGSVRPLIARAGRSGWAGTRGPVRSAPRAANRGAGWR